MRRVLVVDGDDIGRRKLAAYLKGLGCAVASAASGSAALNALRRDPFDLAFCDLALAGEDGLDLLPRLRAERPGLDVVMLTASASLDTAVAALERGARDYLPKPPDPGRIRALVARAHPGSAPEHRATRARPRRSRSTRARLETSSLQMQAVLRLVERAAARDVDVLLRGEEGAGKSVLARALHGWRRSRPGPLVVVSCARVSDEALSAEIFGHARGAFEGALFGSEGRLEAAEGGMLYLDEVAELSPSLQGRLLRFLRERTFERDGEPRTRTADVRILAATIRDLERETNAGRFREDLLHHLKAVEIVVPPLRERFEDILPFARSFAASFARRAGSPVPEIPAATQELLMAWHWPGNVRELRDAMERAVSLAPGGPLAPEVFPPGMAPRSRGEPALGGDCTLEEIQREHVARVLARSRTFAEASRILDVDVSTLRSWRRAWGAGAAKPRSQAAAAVTQRRVSSPAPAPGARAPGAPSR